MHSARGQRKPLRFSARLKVLQLDTRLWLWRLGAGGQHVGTGSSALREAEPAGQVWARPPLCSPEVWTRDTNTAPSARTAAGPWLEGQPRPRLHDRKVPVQPGQAPAGCGSRCLHP